MTSKARTLASTVSTGAVLADGTVAVAEVTGLATVATSGAYSDVSGTPTLPTFPTGDVVGATDVQTLTNKTVEAGTFTNGYTEETFVANTGTAITINLANGSVQILTLTGNVVYTFPTPVAGQSFILIHKQDATGSRTATWPGSVDWPGGTAPTLTATALKADKFVFTAIDGSNWLGSVAGQAYTV